MASQVEIDTTQPGWEAVAYYELLSSECAYAELLYERAGSRYGPQLRAIMAELDRVQQSFWS